jgi:hypothetical protein
MGSRSTNFATRPDRRAAAFMATRPAERMTDEIDFAGASRKGRFDEARLIGKRLSRLGRPGRRLAISEQVHCADVKMALQIVHQPTPLAGG